MKFDHKKWKDDPVKPEWRIQKNYDDQNRTIGFTIYCPRCSNKVIEYLDGTKLIPIDIVHCGVEDRVYVAQVIFKTDTTDGEKLKKERDRLDEIPF